MQQFASNKRDQFTTHHSQYCTDHVISTALCMFFYMVYKSFFMVTIFWLLFHVYFPNTHCILFVYRLFFIFEAEQINNNNETIVQYYRLLNSLSMLMPTTEMKQAILIDSCCLIDVFCACVVYLFNNINIYIIMFEQVQSECIDLSSLIYIHNIYHEMSPSSSSTFALWDTCSYTVYIVYCKSMKMRQ